jgi:hypothetical protein
VTGLLNERGGTLARKSGADHTGQAARPGPLSLSSPRERCPECGSPLGIWNKMTILEACHAWVERHGEPPKQADWMAASPWSPNATRVQQVFGSWNTMIVEAGYTPRRRGGRPSFYTREKATEILFQWAYDHGRLPTTKDWKLASPDRPSRDQITLLFGSWNAFIVAAGYEPEKKYRTMHGYSMQAENIRRWRNKDTGRFGS